MKSQKGSLVNAKQLSNAEMMKIMAGDGVDCNCNSSDDCTGDKKVCVNGCGGVVGPPNGRSSYAGVCDIQ